MSDRAVVNELVKHGSSYPSVYSCTELRLGGGASRMGGLFHLSEHYKPFSLVVEFLRPSMIAPCMPGRAWAITSEQTRL